MPAPYQDDSAAVLAHLTLKQQIIQRMAGNSTSCKTWCVTLASAVIVLVADKGKPELALLAFLPTIVFMVLDAYYLALETALRAEFEAFVKKLHAGTLTADDIYAVRVPTSLLGPTWRAIGSFSVWFTYVPLLSLIYLTQQFLLNP